MKCIAEGVVVSLLAGTLLSAAAHAQCTIQRRGDLTGGVVGSQVTAVVSFDDGTGPSVFASAYPGTNAIVRRRAGEAWAATAFGPGAVGSGVRVLYVDEDPVNGPTLLAGAGNQVLRWSGAAQRWETFGPAAPWQIWALARHTDASGSHLVSVSTAGSSVQGVAQRLTASGWERIGAGNNWMQGQAVASVDPDGDGPMAPELFVVGRGGSDGQVGNADVMKWNGESWLALPRLSGWSKSAVVFDDGTGPKLFASGHLNPPVLQNTSIAKWTGEGWVAIDNRPQNPLRNDDLAYGLTVFDDGTGHGPELYGLTFNSLVRLRGGVFTRLGTHSNSVASLTYQQLIIGAGGWTLGGASALWIPSGAAVTPYFGCPRCAGDFDQNGAAEANDVFTYLSAWFSARAEADTNQSGGAPTLQDLFDFLNGWFAGCA